MADIINVIPGTTPVLPPTDLPGVAVAVAGANHIVEAARSDVSSDMALKAGVTNPEDFFLQKVLIGKVSIANTDAPNLNLLGEYFDPLWSYLNHPLVAKRWAGFAHLRAGISVTAVMVAPGACYGAYNLQALAQGGVASGGPADEDGPIRDAYYTSFQDEHAVMNCQMLNSVQIDCPFLHPTDAIELAVGGNKYHMWRFMLWPISAVQSTIAATATGTILIYANLMPGYVFENRVLQMKKSFPVPKDKASTKLSKLSGVATRFSSAVPILKPFMEPVAAGLAAMSSVADIFGFTKESAPQQPQPYVRRVIGNPLTIDGTDGSEPLALSGGNAVTIDSAVADGEREDVMSYSSLFARWTVVKRFEISTATPVGFVEEIAVSPSIVNKIGEYAYFTTAGYAAIPFTYWSGDMEYCVYIPSAESIKGSLQVFWSPRLVVPPITTDPTAYLNGIMIDLCGSSRNRITVPMAAPSPFRQIFPFEANKSSNVDFGAINGYLIFYLTAPMVCPRVGATLPIVVLARGASNMRFHVPTQWGPNNNGNNLGETMSFRYKFQSGGIDDNVDEVSTNLNPHTSYPDVAKIYMGEEIASVRAMVQRFSFIGPATVNQTENGCSWLSVTYPPCVPVDLGILAVTDCNIVPGRNQLCVGGTKHNYFTLQAHYLAMYVGVRGGYRVKVVGQNMDRSNPDVNQPFNFTAFAASSEFMDYLRTHCGTNAQLNASFIKNPDHNFPWVSGDVLPVMKTEVGLEVSVPYYSSRKFITSVRHWNVQSEHYYGAQVVLHMDPPYLGTTTHSPVLNVFVASGPDVGVSRFRRTPALKFSSNLP